jgi:hypothetical protein
VAVTRPIAPADLTPHWQHHQHPLFSRPDRLHDPLYVITPVFNAVRYRSRWRLYEDFAKRVYESGAILYTVEVAFGDRDFAVTEAGHPQHVQLRTGHELWLKENSINVAVSRLPSDWKYVAWIDSDVAFARDDWADETRHALQHYQLVQMFSEAIDLNPENEGLGKAMSFVWCTLNGHPTMVRAPNGAVYPYFARKPGQIYPHPGYAWAARREAWDALGGLIDISVVAGGGDWHMAHALVGEIEWTLKAPYHPAYKTHMREWQKRCDRYIRRNIGIVPGLVLHHWHGPKTSRRYWSRTGIFTKHQFNPETDIKRDWQGLYQLTDEKPQLRDDIRAYFRARNEDAI